MKNSENGRRTGWLLAAFILLLAFVALIAAASVASARARENRESAGQEKMWDEAANDREFDARDIDSVEISYSSQNIYLYTGEKGKIRIKEYLQGGREQAQIVVKGNTLSCRGSRRSFFFFTSWSGEERIEVYLPPEFSGQLSLESASGDIRSEEKWNMEEFSAETSSGDIQFLSVTANKITAETSSGEVYFEHAQGDRSMSTSSGRLTVLNGSGDGSFETSSGDITVEGITGKCRAKASSGSISLSVESLEGDLEAITSSGSMRIFLPEDSSFSYEGRSGSGGIRTAFDEALLYNEKRNKAEGSYGANGDGPEFHLRTKASSGDTVIKFR